MFLKMEKREKRGQTTFRRNGDRPRFSPGTWRLPPRRWRTGSWVACPPWAYGGGFLGGFAAGGVAQFGVAAGGYGGLTGQVRAWCG